MFIHSSLILDINVIFILIKSIKVCSLYLECGWWHYSCGCDISAINALL